jgi:excisionase family DNA binding protein
MVADRYCQSLVLIEQEAKMLLEHDDVHDVWMTRQDAANYLGVSVQTIQRWVRDGMLTEHEVGGAPRYHQKGLDAVIEKLLGYAEARRMTERCTSCGHCGLVHGRVKSPVPATPSVFQPNHTRFWMLHRSVISMEARACPCCGHVQYYIRPEDLYRRVPAKEITEHPELAHMQR